MKKWMRNLGTARRGLTKEEEYVVNLMFLSVVNDNIEDIYGAVKTGALQYGGEASKVFQIGTLNPLIRQLVDEVIERAEVRLGMILELVDEEDLE